MPRGPLASTAAAAHLTSALVAILLVYTTAASVWEAAHRPFWFDEVFTAILTEKPSFTQVMSALGEAADTSGPGYYVVQRAIRGVVSDPHVAYRLPSIVATSLVGVTLFLFARRDLGTTAGALAVLFVLASQLYHGYSVEARVYALVAFGVALAALAWQRADSWRWTAVLIASAAGSVALHYYAVFALVPIGAAEAVRLARTRRVRWGVWAALGSGGLMLLWLWPLLSAVRAYYAGHYWSTASIGKVLATYDTLSGFGFPGGGLGLAVVLCLALTWFAWASTRATPPNATWPPPETLVLVLGLVGLPVIVAAVAWLMNGGYTDRYAIGVIPGLALGVAYLSGALDARLRAWLLVCATVVFATHELAFWGNGSSALGIRQGPAMNAQQALLAKAAALDLPLVVSSGLDYVPLVYYHQATAIDFVAVVDYEQALHYDGTDSIERDLVVLDHHLPLRVQSLATFRDANPAFLLLTRPGPFSWRTTYLFERGYAFTAVHQDGLFTLFKVERP